MASFDIVHNSAYVQYMYNKFEVWELQCAVIYMYMQSMYM